MGTKVVPNDITPLGRAVLGGDFTFANDRKTTFGDVVSFAAATLGGRTGASRLVLPWGSGSTPLPDTSGSATVDVTDFDEELEAPVVQISQPAPGVGRDILLTVGLQTPDMELKLEFLGDVVYVWDSEDSTYTIDRAGLYLLTGITMTVGPDTATMWRVVALGSGAVDDLTESIARGYGASATPDTGAPFVGDAITVLDIRTANRTVALQPPEGIDDRSWLGRRLTLLVACGPHALTLQPGRPEIAIDIAGAVGSPGSDAFAPTLAQGIQRFDVVGGLSADGLTPTWYVTPGASIFDVVSGIVPVAGTVSAGPLDISRKLAFAGAGSYTVTLPAPGDVLAPIDITVVFGGSAAQSLTWGRNGGTINGAAADFATPGSATGRIIRITNPGPSVGSGGSWVVQALANRGESDTLLDVTGASATITGAYGTYRVTYAAGACALTIDPTAWPIGASRVIVKDNTTANTITLTPPSGGTVQGGATNASMTLPGSGSTVGAASGRLRWVVTRTDTLAYSVSDGAVVYVDGANVSVPGWVLASRLRSNTAGTAADVAVRVGTNNGRGLFDDATTGLSASVDSVPRMLLRTNGIAEFASGVGGGTAVVRLSTTAGGVSVFVYNANPEGVITAGPGSECFDFANGRLYIKRTGTGNTGWRLMEPSEAGTYTPTLTAIANISAVGTPTGWRYLTVGDQVVVSGLLQPTLTGLGAYQLDFSLPIASAFVASTDLVGTSTGIGFTDGRLTADATNDRGAVLGTGTSTTPAIRVTAMYGRF